MIDLKNNFFGFFDDYEKLREKVEAIRVLGAKISMTQGVFDLLHPGHTRYLRSAQSFGDVLVVAVDTDEYTRLRKQTINERRPAVPFGERIEILESLRYVNLLTYRDVKEHTEDPYHVIKVVRPDVLVVSRSTKDVTGEDYEALREFCGEVKLLEPTAVISTTKRLRELLSDGAAGLADKLVSVIEDYFRQAGREIVIGGKKDKNND
jgi:D-beta-D-heptose 7-phosphate kinase/D-beta-D-heptose 1-phosphate adenosyltransferase